MGHLVGFLTFFPKSDHCSDLAVTVVVIKFSPERCFSVPSFLACVCDERCDLVIVPPLLLSNCIVDCGASLQWPAAGWAGLFREKLHFISFLIVAADNV